MKCIHLDLIHVSVVNSDKNLIWIGKIYPNNFPFMASVVKQNALK